MISFLPPEDYRPLFDTAPIAAQIAKAHAQFSEAALLDALIARFGELPPIEVIAAQCMKVIDHENVTHFVWFDGEKPKIGETPDMSGLLCSIAPPKFGDLGN